MLNNYYIPKYIEHMTGKDICESSKDIKNMKNTPLFNEIGAIISNNNAPSQTPFEYIIYTLPQFAVISNIKFDITSTDQGFGNNDGTQYELVLRYGNTDYPLTQKIFCVDFRTKNYTERNNKVSDIFQFQPYIKTENQNVKLVFKLYNLYPAHSAKITSYNINISYFN